MRGRIATFAAVWVVMAVLSSAVLTCVPGSMKARLMPMAGCGDMAMPARTPALAVNPATDCCVRHEPTLTVSKIDLAQIPLVRIGWIAPSATVAALSHLAATPHLKSAAGPPVYITLSILRV